MSISYLKLIKHPNNFLQLTGLKIEDFNKIIDQVRSEWDLRESKKKSHGRKSHFESFEDRVLCAVIYYRSYISHTFLGYLFNLHNSNICRNLQIIEPLLAKKITITKDRSLTQDRILEIIVDCTEQKIQKPKKKQKASYSGKKKIHTVKTEIVIDINKRILNVSNSYKGSMHDFAIRKTERLLPIASKKYGDSGYQGLQNIQTNVNIPIKKSKKKPLSKEDRLYNKGLSFIRIKVEHVFREIKIFKIMSDTYRNFQQKHNMRFNIIAGIVNLKNGY